MTTTLDGKMTSQEKNLYDGKLTMILPVIIKPPHNSAAIRASLPSQGRLQNVSCAYKIEVNFLAIQSIRVQSTIGGRYIKCVVKSKAETL